MSNADLLTNEQLLRGPETSVLAALPGGFSHVIFDESHLGVADSGSVASLARAHQLQWLVFAFLLVAALYVWRSSVSFVPPLETSREFVVPGRDAHSTLESLLQRSISKRQLWGVLIREWNRSLPLLKRGFPLEETDIVANSRSNEAVAETYKRLGEKANGYSVWRK